MTAAAAAIGVRRQPSIKSRTIKNSAAASAAEMSASAAFAARCGRPAGSSSATRVARERSARAVGTRTTAQASATGTWTKKIDCHEISSVSRPPIPGPSAAPSAPEAAQIVAARRSDPTADGSSSSDAQTAPAPPIACAQRAASSSPIDPASPQMRLASPKQSRPASATRRRAEAPRGTRGRQRRQREHEVERDEHPGDGRDRDVELAVDLGEREDDDRRVGKHERDRDG